TTDGGATWASIAGDLPQAPVNDIVVVGSTLYVGTDVGVFLSANGGAAWLTAGADLPNVPVTDLEYRAASNSVYAATFGRGSFVLPLSPTPTPTATPTPSPTATPTPTPTATPTPTPTATPTPTPSAPTVSFV